MDDKSKKKIFCWKKNAASFFANICKLAGLLEKVVKTVLITNFRVLSASVCVWTDFFLKNFYDRKIVVLMVLINISENHYMSDFEI